MDRRERDGYVDEVLIGGREKREIVIVGYDPAWPDRFERERERIRSALGATALRIEHIERRRECRFQRRGEREPNGGDDACAARH